jgi:integrase
VEDVIELLAKSASILPPRARGNCRIWFTWKDSPVFISAGTKKPKEAREVLRAKIGEWLAKLPKEVPAPPQATGHPWKEWSQKFLESEHKHSKPGYRDGVAQVLEDFGAIVQYPDVTTMTPDVFREAWKTAEAGRKAKTWANWLGILGSFARFLVREDVIVKDFTIKVKRPPKELFGTHEEIYREEWFQPIWEALEIKWRAPWEDHWFTGMDTGDLWEIEPQKHMTETDGAWKIWKLRAKENERIDQPLSSRIRDRWIAARVSGQPYLHMDGRRYANAKSWGTQLRKAVRQAQAKLGLPRLDIKATRHTFATRHALRLVRGEKNAPTLDEIRRWLGQAKDSRMLEKIYLKLLSQPHLMD